MTQSALRRDADSSAMGRSNFGPKNTFTGFSWADGPSKLIDFVLVLDNGVVQRAQSTDGQSESRALWQVDRAGVVSNECHDERGDTFRCSDHQLAVARLAWIG